MVHYNFGSTHARSRSFQPVPHSPLQFTSLLRLVPSCTNLQARRCSINCAASNTAGVTGSDEFGDLSRLSPEAFWASQRASTPAGALQAFMLSQHLLFIPRQRRGELCGDCRYVCRRFRAWKRVLGGHWSWRSIPADSAGRPFDAERRCRSL